jgi:phage tail sheath gpL-like
MSISFNNVPASYRASKVFIELAGVRKSLAGLFIPPTAIIIGMYDPLKTATVDYVPVKVTSAEDVGLKAGFGSHAHRQALRFPDAVFLQGGGVYWIPVPEVTAGVAAKENITFTGTATSAGSFYFNIGGELVKVNVASGDAAADIAGVLEDEITAIQNIAVTGSASGAITKLASKFKGTQGNQILVFSNPSGESQEAENPAGVTVTLGNVGGYLATGATDPDLEDAFFNTDGSDKLGDRWYTHITMPFVDATNIAHYKTIAGLRADPSVNRFFGAYSAYVGKTYAQALALPATVNSKYIGQIWEDRYQCPDFELAAELIGQMLIAMNEAPNRPYKTLALEGAFNSDTVNRRYLENDALFRAGMSYCDNVANVLQLGDIALTYRTNQAGAAATDWFDAVSLHRRQAKAYSLEQLFKTEKYQRAVVVDNSAVTRVDFALAPKDVISDLTKLITELWGPYGWTKNVDTVIDSLTAEINSTYESRIDAQVTDDEAQALRIVAIKYAFLY